MPIHPLATLTIPALLPQLLLTINYPGIPAQLLNQIGVERPFKRNRQTPSTKHHARSANHKHRHRAPPQRPTHPRPAPAPRSRCPLRGIAPCGTAAADASAPRSLRSTRRASCTATSSPTTSRPASVRGSARGLARGWPRRSRRSRRRSRWRASRACLSEPLPTRWRPTRLTTPLYAPAPRARACTSPRRTS
mgnify:CR=1 FL=1